MNALARMALRFYPRDFRDRVGSEYLRHVGDLAAHRHTPRWRIGALVIGELFTTALRLRWEILMPRIKRALIIFAAIVALSALVIGSPAIALLIVALVVMIGLQFAGRDRPIRPTDPLVTRRWYLWLGGGVLAFLVGLAALAIDGDDELSAPIWATWLLSWATAALFVAVGIGLGAVRLLAGRH